MPSYKACNPPCANSRCYGCNATARDLAVSAKKAGKKMVDLPDWAQSRVRRMVAQTESAQATSQAYSDARMSGMAYGAKAIRDAVRSIEWRCTGCGNEQGANDEKYVHMQRRYCSKCAAPFKAAELARDNAAQEAQAVQAAIMAANPLESIYAKGKAAWTGDERMALVAAKMVCVHCSKRINTPSEPGCGEYRKHCHACYMARAYGEQQAAQAAAKSAEGIANVGAVLSGQSAAQDAKRANAEPLADRFALIELDEVSPEVEEKARKESREESINNFVRPIELD